MMRQGMHPKDACLEALKRVARNYNNDMKKLRQFALNFYALNKKGEHGSASLWSTRETENNRRARGVYSVNDGRENKFHDMAYLYEWQQR
jgi:N4-(beta-N-acetylglucosaminyl)-L-asparaginase